MKIKEFFKCIFTVIISILIMLVYNTYSNAFSLNITSNEKSINKGDTITVTVTADSKFVTSDFELKYDSNLFEYVEENQANVSIKDYKNEGYVIVVYADITGKGTNSVSIKFKAKATTSNSSQFSIQKQNFTDIEGTSYDSSTATANSLSVSVKEDNSNSNSQNGNNNNTGTSGSQNENNSNTGTSGSQNGNNSNTGTSGSKNGNNSNTGTSGSQNGNNSNAGTSASQSGGNGNVGTTTSSNKNSVNASTTQKNSSLPKTGIGFNVLVVFIIIAIIMAIIFRKKIQYWRGIGMFILVFTITIMCSSNNIYAYTKMNKYGVFSNIIEKQNVLAISFDNDETEKELKVKQIPSLVNNVSSYKDKNGKNISESSTIGTGSRVQLKDNTEYVVLLYGDVTGDGKINSNDIYPIIQHILKNQTLTGVYAKAANLNNKNDENDQNINSSDIYQIIKFMLGDLKSDLVYNFPSKANEKLNLNVTYDKKEWTKDSVVVTISSSTELVTPDANWKLSEDKKQISKIYKENTKETLEVKSADGRSGKVEIAVSNIDKTSPSISENVTVSSQTAAVGQDVQITVSAKSSDAESGIDKITYELYKGDEKIQEQQITESSVFTFKATKGITYNVRIYATDKVGNASKIETMKVEQLNYLDTDEGKKDLSDETTRYNENLKGINDAIESKQNQLKSINNSYYAEKATLDSTLNQKLKSVETEKAERLSELNKRTESIVNSLIEERDDALAQAKNQYDDDIAAAKKKGATTEQINDIKTAYSNKKKVIQDDYAKQMSIRKKQLEQEENDINSLYNSKKQGIQEEYAKDLNTLDNKYDSQRLPIINDINNFVGARDSVISGYNSYKNNLENMVYINITK